MTSTDKASTAMNVFVRRPLAVLLLLASLALVGGAAAPVAAAQASVVGSADFRGAPQLPPGEYRDQIVTGDTAWYAVVYTNNTPYEFTVAFDGVDPGSGVTLEASFVAPTLTLVDGPGAVVSGSGVEYPAGHTNVWFVQVSLSSRGQLGTEYPIRLSVSGVEALGVEPCAETPGCMLDEEYAALNVAIAESQAELDVMRAQETIPNVGTEIENLKGFSETAEQLVPAANARLAKAEAAIAALCAPEPDCDEFPDPGSKTPLIGWIIGGLALIGGAYKGLKGLQHKPEKEPEPPPRRPASLARR